VVGTLAFPASLCASRFVDPKALGAALAPSR
jgi:hypothetical protein